MSNAERKTSERVWLELPKYHVVPLKPDLTKHVMKLARAIQQGIWADREFGRPDFFDVELENGWVYIHLYPHGQIVYVIAELGRTGTDSFEREQVCREI